MAAEPGRDGDGEDSWQLVSEPAHESLAEAVRIAAWRRLVRSLQRIRRLQRIWGLLGQFLQTFPSELRQSLLDNFPKKK